jgi:hypothetical protein
MKKQQLLVETRKQMVERVEFIDPLIYACGHKGLIDETNDIPSIFARVLECTETQTVAKISIVYIDMLNNNTFEVLKRISFSNPNRELELEKHRNRIIDFIKSETLSFIESIYYLLSNQMRESKNEGHTLPNSLKMIKELQDAINEIKLLK